MIELLMFAVGMLLSALLVLLQDDQEARRERVHALTFGTQMYLPAGRPTLIAQPKKSVWMGLPIAEYDELERLSRDHHILGWP